MHFLPLLEFNEGLDNSMIKGNVSEQSKEIMLPSKKTKLKSLKTQIVINVLYFPKQIFSRMEFQ